MQLACLYLPLDLLDLLQHFPLTEVLRFLQLPLNHLAPLHTVQTVPRPMHTIHLFV